ncbi:lipid A export permease/ATP-binding protein MsbA [Parachitinimonas caeni]|uniref:Lipid A export permease/ATP-binding protein MsbA n=1 Tax=Parachitinimonas caeni TaxID=3031301 RepID=A0ABT7E4R4_9NEIS|nr:lipid A export permease/ATP-binding protein MsbA [Parachitinimonas caeni]MDK2126430.1 lipid A export permease/ATP-binding protein MsbA [Parachitinimonas caeni]
MNSRQLYLRILGYIRPYFAMAVLTIIALALASAADVALISQLENVFNALSPDRMPKPALAASASLLPPEWANSLAEMKARFTPGPGSPLWVVPAIVLGLAVLRMLASFVGEYGGSWLSSRIQHDLRERMFDRLLTLPTRYYDKASAGVVLSRLTYDVTQISQAGINVLNVAVKDGVMVIGLLYAMLVRDWQLTLFCLLLAPLVALVVSVAGRRLRKIGRGTQNAMGELTRILDEAIAGQRVVKIFGGARYERERFHRAANDVRGLNVKHSATAAANSGLVGLLVGVTLAAIIYFASVRAQAGQLSAGEFVAFMAALLAIQSPIKNLTKLNEQLQRGLAAAESVFALVDEMPEVDRGHQSMERCEGRIEFRAVEFLYGSDGRKALDAVSISVLPGETVALVGSSGSGKTTLANLLPRFYELTGGQILLDGHDLNQYTLESLRQQIALVSQDVVLFNDSIAANIAYGDAQVDMQRVKAAAEAAFASEFIERMPDGFLTLIGENGVRLSGGQRQRLAIARALYKDAPILILDEATSALDTESERKVQAALATLMRGRTTLVIAHRLSTIEHADRIVVLDRGLVVEEGSHADLLARNGAYARLRQQQALADPGQGEQESA